MSVDEAKNRILQRVSLPELIGEKIELKVRGGRHTGLCPFHEERSPSFTVFDDHYFCFGCRATGDAINYIRETQGLSFMETLRYLAEKYGLEVPELEKPNFDKSARLVEAQLYKISAEAAQYFREQMARPLGAKAREYVANRGFSPEFAAEYGFGLSTTEPLALVNHLLKKGFAIKDMISASVALASQHDQRAYDFFINRLMIPIADMHGRVIAFGGRSLGDDLPKYKNSMNTPLFDKSHVLYGLDRAKETIRRDRQAIVCEGYMDVLQLSQAGISSSVACLGTALSLPHLRRLGALTPQIYLVFDGDKAGRNATLRTVNIALEVPQAECKVVVLPVGEDPDTFVTKYGADAFRAQLQTAKGLLDFAIETRIKETHDLGIPELVSKEIIPWLQSVKDPMSRNFLMNRISELTGIAVDGMAQAVRGDAPIKKAPPKMMPLPEEQLNIPKTVTALRGNELELFGHLFWALPEELDIDQIEHMFNSQLELEEVWLEFAHELIKALRRGLTPSQQNKAFWTTGSTPEVLDLILGLEISKGAYETEFRQRQFEKLFRVLQKKQLDETTAKLKAKLASSSGDEEMEILMAISRIKKELILIDNPAKRPVTSS
ncbi:MAG: DNA primase [Chitinophagaceae bacterium]|nr:DNA primase [Oligoflexus sp.]